MRHALLVLAALLVAGCAEEPDSRPSPTPAQPSAPTPSPTPPAERWHLGGAWTAEYTQADIDAWCAIAEEYDNECVVMESFPPQYALAFASEAECLEARDRILALEHITARACVPQQPASGDPDGSTSSPAEGGDAIPWRLHGTFTADYTADDIRAVCQAGTGEPDCAMMKSFPPQYSFGFVTIEKCEEARAKIAAVPHAVVDECESS